MNLVRAERVWKLYRLNAPSGIMFNHKTIHRDNREGREKTKPEEMRFGDYFIAVQLQISYICRFYIKTNNL